MMIPRKNRDPTLEESYDDEIEIMSDSDREEDEDSLEMDDEECDENEENFSDDELLIMDAIEAEEEANIQDNIIDTFQIMDVETAETGESVPEDEDDLMDEEMETIGSDQDSDNEDSSNNSYHGSDQEDRSNKSDQESDREDRSKKSEDSDEDRSNSQRSKEARHLEILIAQKKEILRKETERNKSSNENEEKQSEIDKKIPEKENLDNDSSQRNNEEVIVPKPSAESVKEYKIAEPAGPKNPILIENSLRQVKATLRKLSSTFNFIVAARRNVFEDEELTLLEIYDPLSEKSHKFFSSLHLIIFEKQESLFIKIYHQQKKLVTETKLSKNIDETILYSILMEYLKELSQGTNRTCKGAFDETMENVGFIDYKTVLIEGNSSNVVYRSRECHYVVAKGTMCDPCKKLLTTYLSKNGLLKIHDKKKDSTVNKSMLVTKTGEELLHESKPEKKRKLDQSRDQETHDIQIERNIRARYENQTPLNIMNEMQPQMPQHLITKSFAAKENTVNIQPRKVSSVPLSYAKDASQVFIQPKKTSNLPPSYAKEDINSQIFSNNPGNSNPRISDQNIQSLTFLPPSGVNQNTFEDGPPKYLLVPKQQQISGMSYLTQPSPNSTNRKSGVMNDGSRVIFNHKQGTATKVLGQNQTKGNTIYTNQPTKKVFVHNGKLILQHNNAILPNSSNETNTDQARPMSPALANVGTTVVVKTIPRTFK